MTVQELIDELKTFNQDADICVCAEDGNIVDIDKVYAIQDDSKVGCFIHIEGDPNWRDKP